MIGLLEDKEPLSNQVVADLVVRHVLAEDEMKYDKGDAVRALMSLFWVTMAKISAIKLSCQKAEDYYRGSYVQAFEKNLGRKPSNDEGRWPDCMDIEAEWHPAILRRVAIAYGERDARDTKTWFDFCEKQST